MRREKIQDFEGNRKSNVLNKTEMEMKLVSQQNNPIDCRRA